ncbi:uncharacterized protein ATNIH1004_002052 [Aspergillus tanneri]|uniref:Uncharacterized protein n=1 Tax=Aspergillus tanneri TaxID=1220188 RepID=A0A5M9M2P9_9EURO|nr:uncharacterized protein ATNIH1004_002052 [Aspergillus tanneri]KAA8641312.1 hypothetical protein ATNIH1004_002052 [Aspergillus tanneri]
MVPLSRKLKLKICRRAPGGDSTVSFIFHFRTSPLLSRFARFGNGFGNHSAGVRFDRAPGRESGFLPLAGSGVGFCLRADRLLLSNTDETYFLWKSEPISGASVAVRLAPNIRTAELPVTGRYMRGPSSIQSSPATSSLARGTGDIFFNGCSHSALVPTVVSSGFNAAGSSSQFENRRTRAGLRAVTVDPELEANRAESAAPDGVPYHQRKWNCSPAPSRCRKSNAPLPRWRRHNKSQQQQKSTICDTHSTKGQQLLSG